MVLSDIVQMVLTNFILNHGNLFIKNTDDALASLRAADALLTLLDVVYIIPKNIDDEWNASKVSKVSVVLFCSKADFRPQNLLRASQAYDPLYQSTFPASWHTDTPRYPHGCTSSNS